jgi:hypothetical protein
MAAETARIVLVTRKLRWSSPLLFSDAFDVPADLTLPFEREELQVEIARRIADTFEARGVFKQPQLAALARRLQALPNHSELRAEIVAELRRWPVAGVNLPSLADIDAFWEKLRPQMRILCLCERNDVTPMWDIYADQYRGLVLELTRRPYLDTPLAFARPVTYRESPPRLASLERWADAVLDEKPFELRSFFDDYQYVKGSHWSNELEWRLITYAKAGDTLLYSDLGFFPVELSAIYLGSRMTDGTAREFKALLVHGLEHARVFRAIEDQRAAKFTFERAM